MRTEARQIAEKLLDGNLNGMAIIHDDVTLSDVERLATDYLALEARCAALEYKQTLIRTMVDKTAKWLRRLERKAAAQGESNKSHLPAFSEACFADARNYGSVANDLEAALTDSGGQG